MGSEHQRDKYQVEKYVNSSIVNAQNKRIYETFFEISKAEQHFNSIQTNYRQIASLWLLGAFSAIGYVLTIDKVSKIDVYLMSSFIAICSNIGLILLWSMDLLVYHRLLDAYFLEGLVYERKYEFLPPIRHTMMSSQDGTGKGVLVRLINFYVVPCIIMTAISAGVFIMYVFSDLKFYNLIDPKICGPIIGTIVVYSIVGIFIYFTMHRKTMNSRFFEDRLANFPSPNALKKPEHGKTDE